MHNNRSMDKKQIGIQYHYPLRLETIKSPLDEIITKIYNNGLIFIVSF